MSISKNVTAVLSRHPLFIGGHPAFNAGIKLPGSLSGQQFVGCMNNILIKENNNSFNYSSNINLSRLHGRVLGGVCPII